MLGQNRNPLPLDVSATMKNHQKDMSNLPLKHSELWLDVKREQKHSARGLDVKRAQNSRLKRAAERDLVRDDDFD